MKTQQLQKIYDNFILISERIKKDIEIQTEAITDFLS